MTGSPSSTLREAGTSQPQRRRLGRRLSATHVLISVVVILAFVLNFLVLVDRDATVLVAMAEDPIPAGSTFQPGDLGLVSLDEGFEGVEAFVTEDDLAGYQGHVYVRSVAAGSPILIDALGSPGASDGLRTMSLPISLEHAAGGSLTEGDVIDVVSVFDSVAEFVATGLEVVGVAEPGGSAIGSSAGYYVVVAVDPVEALALASALDSGSIEIIKATGAAPVGTESGDGP